MRPRHDAGGQQTRSINAQRRETLYRPLNTLLVRAPLLPIENYNRLHTASDCIKLSETNLAVQEALAVGSIALLDELERPVERPTDQRQRERKLLRYLIRMTTRPTPYGMFAGVALAHWAEETNLALAEKPGIIRARPDMEWLLHLIWRLEALPEVRAHLRLATNSAAAIRKGKVFLLEAIPGDAVKSRKHLSINATRAALLALELARHPISYNELAHALLTTTPNATPQKINQLLGSLLQHTFLLTDLRPPLTTSDPAAYLLERLAGIAEIAPVYEALHRYIKAMEGWQQVPLENRVSAYRDLLTMAADVQRIAGVVPRDSSLEGRSQPGDTVSSNVIQADQTFRLQGATVARSLGEEIASAVEVLLRISPVIDGYPYLSTYRELFVERYGEQREVPVLEALDPYFGLGLPEYYTESWHQETSPRLPTLPQRREQALTSLAIMALRNRQLVVDLNEQLLEDLEPAILSVKTLPPSLDVYVLAAAASQEALARGEYRLVIGPNVGAQQSGRNLGRFAQQFGPEAMAAYEQGARDEEALTPGTIWAELLYPPTRTRLTNVAIRPPVRHYEIVYGMVSETPGVQTIPIDELMLGIRNGRFYLRWLAREEEVIISAGHMLNPLEAPPLIRFLSDLNQDRTAQLATFYWGAAEAFPFLPRIQRGRVVLRPAQWTITTLNHLDAFLLDSEERFMRSLEQWRVDWNVPRYAYMGEGDHRLLLDLHNPLQAAELHAALKRILPDEVLVLQEGLPGPEEAWVPGPGGHYLTECVVSLALQQQAPVSEDASKEKEERGVSDAFTRGTGSRLPRLKPPGSDWLFTQIYCATQLQDEFIAESLRPFAQTMLQQGFAEDWFFIRYSGDGPHIRLRFRGEPGRLLQDLLPRLCEWITPLLAAGPCVNFSLNAYDREIERYGGPEGLEASELLFGADSWAVAELLHLTQIRALSLDRGMLAVLGMDNLLAELGLSPEKRLQWYHAFINRSREAGTVYRQKSPLLRLLLGQAGLPAEIKGMELVQEIFATRGKVVQQVARQLDTAMQAGQLTQSLESIYGSYLHMYCNRLLGLNRDAEIEALQLLLRTHEGLRRGPMTESKTSRKSHEGRPDGAGAL